MQRVSTPCSGFPASRLNSPDNTENLRRKIVGLALKTDCSGKANSELLTALERSDKTVIVSESEQKNTIRSPTEGCKQRVSTYRDNGDYSHRKHLVPLETTEELHDRQTRSKTPIMKTKNGSTPKIVRFRIDDCKLGNSKDSVVTSDSKCTNNATDENKNGGPGCDYEVRGSAITTRKEGLKGLLAHSDNFAENEKRQHSLQASLKIFRRRIKLNEDKFIQPSETITEDYVIHTRSPIFDVKDTTHAQEVIPPARPLSSDEHVRILRSALHNKHHGGINVTKLTDLEDLGKNYKSFKCSYRLPENPNWGKEVSFKDTSDSIPNVKTYVLTEETNSNVKFKKSNIHNAVTLNTHNLNVHNSITQVSEKKIKLGDTEVAFDPRFLDWLEDSVSNVTLHKSSAFLVEDPIGTPSIRKRTATKT